MTTLGERIRHIRVNILKQKQAVFAENLGGSRVATISDYEKDKRTPDIHTLRKIATMGGTTIDWLLTGNGPITMWEHSMEGHGAFIEVKVYEACSLVRPNDLQGAAPSGSILIPSRDYIKGQIALKLKDSSMKPTVLNGAIVGIDLKDSGFVNGSLYAVWLERIGAAVRRLYVTDGGLILRPDDPEVPETVFNVARSSDGVLGRVVWLYQRYP